MSHSPAETAEKARETMRLVTDDTVFKLDCCVIFLEAMADQAKAPEPAEMRIVAKAMREAIARLST